MFANKKVIEPLPRSISCFINLGGFNNLYLLGVRTPYLNGNSAGGYSTVWRNTVNTDRLACTIKFKVLEIVINQPRISQHTYQQHVFSLLKTEISVNLIYLNLPGKLIYKLSYITCMTSLTYWTIYVSN